MNKAIFFISLMLITTSVVTRIQAQTKPGDIAPNAKILDVDELQPFSDGVAVIKKGSTTALIDPSGNFIVQFGKYIIEGPSKSGLLVVTCTDVGRTTVRKGLINTKGTLVLPCNLPSTNPPHFIFDEQGYVKFITDAGTFFINANGEKVTFNQGGTFKPAPLFYSQGLGAFNEKGKYGYADHSGKTIIAPQFDKAGEFSEGLAVVGKKNEFGEIKYGFIDKSGKVVIPFQYSKQPKDFSSGLAGVEPIKKDEFSFGYIDRKGELVIKINKGLDGNNLLPDIQNPSFVNGFVGWHTISNNRFYNYLIDTTGKMMRIEDFLLGFGIDAKELSMMPNVGLTKFNVWELVGKDSRRGRLDLKTKKTLPCIFRRLGTDSYDPISKLTYTEISLDWPANKKLRKGYINEDGVFVIVKGEGSVF